MRNRSLFLLLVLTLLLVAAAPAPGQLSRAFGAARDNEERARPTPLGSGYLTPGTWHLTPSPAQRERKLADTIEARFWPGPTALEARAELPMWKNAVPVFFQHDTNGDPYVGNATTVRAVWTSDTLWLLFSCAFDHLTISPNPRSDIETNRLWTLSDVAEAFIAPIPADVMRYKEFEVSPAGEWVDLAIDRANNKYDAAWNSGFRVAARIDSGSQTWWTVMAIPLKAFEVETPAPGVQWRLNFFRTEQGPPKRNLAWQPPHSPNFHTPQAFGALVFRK